MLRQKQTSISLQRRSSSSINMFAQKYRDLKNKIANEFFGPGENESTIRDKGNSLHDEILEYS
jgi:hypothetical protein